MMAKKSKQFQEMPFIDQIKHLEGMQVKEVKTIVNEEGNEEIAIVFNDRFGTALFFTKEKKYVGLGATTRYVG